MVLPDEDLFMPVITSIPESVTDVNISHGVSAEEHTCGYADRQDCGHAATWTLQPRRVEFFREDVLNVRRIL